MQEEPELVRTGPHAGGTVGSQVELVGLQQILHLQILHLRTLKRLKSAFC
jgi:hypothetical protein